MEDPLILELALERATANPGARPAFYKLLMASHVFALVEARPSAEGGPHSLIAWVRDDNVLVIPFFSSVSALPPAQQPGLGVARMPVRSLFEATRGLHLHLNPRSGLGREFTPAEITSLLAYGTIHSGVHTRSLPEDTELQINQLSVPLPAIEAALATLLLGHSEVNCSYLVEVARQEAEMSVVTVMLIVEGRESLELAHAISTVISDLYRGEIPIDLCFADAADQLTTTLPSVSALPFYNRSVATRLVAGSNEVL